MPETAPSDGWTPRLSWWQLGHPLWLCAFRPFFALTVLAGVGLMLAWLLFLNLGWPLPAVPGGPFVWHAHELLLGLALAAVAGFALTAVPEFTDTPAFDARAVRRLVVAWLLARLAFWGSGWWAPLLLLAGLAHAALLRGLLALLWPRLWGDAERRHLSFAWALLGLLAGVLGFYVQAWRGAHAMPWLHGLLGALMVLMVVAMSRISMRIVNDALQAIGALDEDGQPRLYLARPPRRNLAMLCLALHTAAAVLGAPASVTGWLALAAAAAMLNLMGDWHVGRALLRRWPLMLYAVYAFMAAGYALMGLALLGANFSPHAGLHLLTTGALGGAIYVVVCIAGHTHSGLDKDGRPWIPLGAGLLAASALLRALAYATAPALAMGLAALLWCGAFGLLGWHLLPVFMRPRADGASGCAGVMESPATAPTSASEQSQ